MSMKIGLGLSGALVGFWLSADGGSAARVDPAEVWPLSIAVAASCLAAATIPFAPFWRRGVSGLVQSGS